MLPILSFCIPTYNRAEFLRKTLESIVSQECIDEIEVVVSDNASDDNTREVAESFVRRFPDIIRYNRNNVNIHDANFWKAMSLGHGDFLKLHNDTAVLRAGVVRRMLEAVKRAKASRSLLFFLNGNGAFQGDERIVCGIDDFIKHTRYWGTWIAAFGIWRDHFADAYLIMKEKSASKLSQSWALFSLIKTGRSVIVNNEVFFDIVPVPKKGGYNIAEIFGRNYNEVLLHFFREGSMSRSCYRVAKKDILKFVNKYYFDVEERFAFRKNGYFKWVFPVYWQNLYFYSRLFHVFFRMSNIALNERLSEHDGK